MHVASGAINVHITSWTLLKSLTVFCSDNVVDTEYKPSLYYSFLHDQVNSLIFMVTFPFCKWESWDSRCHHDTDIKEWAPLSVWFQEPVLYLPNDLCLLTVRGKKIFTVSSDQRKISTFFFFFAPCHIQFLSGLQRSVQSVFVPLLLIWAHFPLCCSLYSQAFFYSLCVYRRLQLFWLSPQWKYLASIVLVDRHCFPGRALWLLFAQGFCLNSLAP